MSKIFDQIKQILNFFIKTLSSVGLVFIVFLFFILFFLFRSVNLKPNQKSQNLVKIKKDLVLDLKLEGIILDASEILDFLKEYSQNDRVKGILLRINSPGGAVVPSQEIYKEIYKIQTQLKKPVVVYGSSLVASGAFYIAMGASQIVVNPATLMGSIGVIMNFLNLEKLYDWAKIKRYALKTGQFKDSGADYRSLSPVEQRVFEDVMSQILEQFKLAIVTGRKLNPSLVDKYSDGRVFLGEKAIELGFADKIGNLQDAIELIGTLSGLGPKPELFNPKLNYPKFLKFFMESQFFKSSVSKQLQEVVADKFLNTNLYSVPLLLLPSKIGL